MAKEKQNVRRHDAVLIRKSSDGQDEAPQIANVKKMLEDRSISVPDKHWRSFTVSRRKIGTNTEFKSLMNEVASGRVRTIYVESQDRFGTKSTKELFSILKHLQDNDANLIDLTEDLDLTSDEAMDEFKTLWQSQRSQAELSALARRSMRSKVNNFKATGTWPTGAAPFGFGKKVLAADKKLRWEWHPTTSRALGQVYNIDVKNGKLVPGTDGIKIPRKERLELTYLVPNRKKHFVKSVQLIFKLFTTEGLSRRQISMRLNDSGYKNYAKPFTHSLVAEILKNPAYVGDTLYGKVQTGELQSFDSEGNIVKVNGERKSSGILKQDTHKPLIDRKTWVMSQARLEREEKQRQDTNSNFSPRSPGYYLKGVLYCGHCGKRMTGRTDNGKPGYVCSTYSTGLSNGQKVECGFHKINHDDAELLIFQELEGRSIEYGKLASVDAKGMIGKKISDLFDTDEAAQDREYTMICEGAAALISYLKNNYELTDPEVSKLRDAARKFYTWGEVRRKDRSDLPIAYNELKEAVKQSEKSTTEKAVKLLSKLQKQHEAVTKKWIHASKRQANFLKAECDKLETEIEMLESQAITISQRLENSWEDAEELIDEWSSLRAEWEGMEDRVKGESLRRIIDRVELFWSKERKDSEAKPSRVRKTKRDGRWSYTLQKDRISFVFRDLELLGSS